MDRKKACRKNRQALRETLLTETEGVDQRTVGVEVGALQVVKELAAARNHAEKAAAGVVVLA